MKKTVFLLSTLILLGTVETHAENARDNSPYRHFEIDKDTIAIIDTRKEKLVMDVQKGFEIVPLREQVIEKYEQTKPSWTSYLTSGAYELGKGVANLGWSATKLSANATWDIATDFVECGIRTAIAYNVAYYDTKAIEWIACKGSNCIASMILGPAAGTTVETVLATTFKVGRYVVPNYEALIAGAATPFVKPITDFAINSMPTVLKATGNVAQSLWSFGKSTADYFWGSTAAAA